MTKPALKKKNNKKTKQNKNNRSAYASSKDLWCVLDDFLLEARKIQAPVALT